MNGCYIDGALRSFALISFDFGFWEMKFCFGNLLVGLLVSIRDLGFLLSADMMMLRCEMGGLFL